MYNNVKRLYSKLLGIYYDEHNGITYKEKGNIAEKLIIIKTSF